MVDLGTGNNNKINWAMNDKQEFIDIVETVYRGARKGRGLVVSPKGKKKNKFQNFHFPALLSLSLLFTHIVALFLLFFCRLFYKIPLLEAI
jgi:hypothetical protein